MKMDDYDHKTEVNTAADAYANAQQVEHLRAKIHEYANGAVNHGGVNKGWVNQRLNRLGAPLVTAQSYYKIRIPLDGVYGTTVSAYTRKEALEKFKAYADNVFSQGEFRGGSYGQGVYEITATGGPAVVVDGPEDVEQTGEPITDLAALKTAIREMLMQGVTQAGWGYGHAVNAAASLNLEPLPTLHQKTVQVPVTGTATVTVPVFSDMDDEAVQDTVAAYMQRNQGGVTVNPDEMGVATWTRPENTSSWTLVSDDDDDEKEPPY